MPKTSSSNQKSANAATRIWRSIFPSPLRPTSQSDRKRYLRRNLLLHFRPALVNPKTLVFTLTWGLGGMAATLVMLQLATGILLKFVYIPTPVDAYASVQTIVIKVPFGRLVRNLHHWCANFLVVILFLHMLRVFLTGAFHSPRQFNWIIGLLLFALVLAANLTGYLLPYDQLAYWAVTVLTAMTGYIPGIGAWLHQTIANGPELGPHTLPFFFSMHTGVIPMALLILMGFHFWRIRKAGGLVVPRDPGELIDATPLRVPLVPHLLIRELCVALSLTAIMLLLSIGFDAALSAPANPGLSPNPVRAPWYFAGLQELLLHFHPSVAVSVMPLLIGTFLVSIPYLAYPQSTDGVWFASANGRRQTAVAAIAAMLITITMIILDTQIVKTLPWASGISPLIRDGVLPLILLAVLTTIFVLMVRRRWGSTMAETIQMLFVIMMAGLVTLTLVGVFFRGPSMKLIWPL